MDSFDSFDISIAAPSAAKTRGELFRALAEAGARMDAAAALGLTADEIEKRILERERGGLTDFGGGVILPHARFHGLTRLSVVMCAQEPPLPPLPGLPAPVRIACMLMIPEEAPMLALKFMSRVVDCIRDCAGVDMFLQLLAANDRQGFRAMLNLDVKKTLTAHDVMRTWRCALTPNMRLADATRLMRKTDVETVPVLSEGRLVGELSCTELFKLGIPDFFAHLKSVGFIRYFDPFENYFTVESLSTVSDAMNADVRAFPEDATLIELVFAIVVEKLPLLYITGPDRKLVGIVDQSVLLDRIINL